MGAEILITTMPGAKRNHTINALYSLFSPKYGGHKCAKNCFSECTYKVWGFWTFIKVTNPNQTRVISSLSSILREKHSNQ